MEAPQLPQIDLPAYASRLFEPWRYKVLYGGRGGARSWTFSRMLVLLAAQHRIRALCGREIQNSIQDSVHQLLADQIEDLKLPGFKILHSPPYEIRHKATGSQIGFKGLRYNAQSIKSYEGVDIAWIEEADRVSDSSWEILIPTIRKPGSEIWVSFNPGSESDPTYKRFVKDPPPDALVLKVGWQDNPFFPDELRREMDYLYRVDPDAAAHVWGGEPRSRSDAQVLAGKWVVEPFEPKETWHGPYQGADWGFAKSPTVLVRCWIADNRLYIEHEAYGVGVDLGRTTDRLFSQVPRARQYTTRADPARPESISLMRRGDADNDPPTWEPWPIVAAPKWAGSVEDGISFLRRFEQIVIHPRCTHAIEQARLYSHKIDQLTGDVLPDIIKLHDDIWDAVRYALAPVIRKRTWGPA